jgi:hypothetical protein
MLRSHEIRAAYALLHFPRGHSWGTEWQPCISISVGCYRDCARHDCSTDQLSYLLSGRAINMLQCAAKPFCKLNATSMFGCQLVNDVKVQEAGLIDASSRYAAAPTLSICGRSHHRTGASLRGVFQEALEDDSSME